jgi:hypothetical protein
MSMRQRAEVQAVLRQGLIAPPRTTLETLGFADWRQLGPFGEFASRNTSE